MVELQCECDKNSLYMQLPRKNSQEQSLKKNATQIKQREGKLMCERQYSDSVGSRYNKCQNTAKVPFTT